MEVLSCAVDKLGHTVDFLLAARRDVAAARRFFKRAIDLHDVPEKITIDKSGANTAAVRGLIADSGVAIELRQSKYLNNIVEQGRTRAIKRRTRPMMGFKSFSSARRISIAGIEPMHMIKKGQQRCPSGNAMSAADRFYSSAHSKPIDINGHLPPRRRYCDTTGRGLPGRQCGR